MVTSILRAAIRKPNTEGLVPSTVGIDLVHTLGINRSGVTRTAIIRKILVYNNTGGSLLPVWLFHASIAIASHFTPSLPTHTHSILSWGLAIAIVAVTGPAYPS